MCPTMEKNPVTGVKEPHFPPRDRLPRILSGIGVIIIMVSSLYHVTANVDLIYILCPHVNVCGCLLANGGYTGISLIHMVIYTAVITV